MKRRLPCLIVTVIVLFVPFVGGAQVDLSSVTARIGVIRTLRSSSENAGHLWSVYPELQFGGALFTPYFSWGFSWGYWADGLNREIPGWVDKITYGEKGHILILRAGFEPQKAASNWLVPLKIFGGVAEHIIFRRYIGGTDITGQPGTSATFSSVTLCGGLSLAVQLSPLLQLEAEAAQFFPIGNGDYDYAQKDRRDFKLGVVMKL